MIKKYLPYCFVFLLAGACTAAFHLATEISQPSASITDPDFAKTELRDPAAGLDQLRLNSAFDEQAYQAALRDPNLEHHDPLRKELLLKYAAFLRQQGRTREAAKLEAEAEFIQPRRKIDRHPAREHVS